MIAFSTTIDYSDLKDYDPYENLLPIRISNLLLDKRHIDELGFTIEQIDEIEGELSQIKNINDLQELVKKYLGENADLKMELQLALSSKNIALAQISAELNRLNSSMVEKNSLLKQFLSRQEFGNLIEKIPVDELIPISALDESQASVVAHALSNRFSVVTGAPGTGKTQVILNIIANALMRDKSVLVASKNNKAVDNVKDRFDNIDPSQYLLRFGKKEYIRSQTIPALSGILNRLNALTSHPDRLSTLLAQYKDVISIIKDAKQKLARINELQVSVPKLCADISSIKSKVREEDNRFSASISSIKSKYSDVCQFEGVSSDAINRILSNITRLRNSLQRKYSGLSKIWHNLFSKKRHAEVLLNHVEDLPLVVKAEFLASELEELMRRKSELANSISRSKSTLVNLGPQLIAAKIVEIESMDGASRKISSYQSYLPDNIPWKDNEIPTFIQRSKEFLSVCRLISVTSLSVKTGFPLTDNLFDILIIDEASQCDVASALPLILRAKQVVVIGDPNQLRHITSVRREEEDAIREYLGLSNRPYLKYAEQSLWDYSAAFLSHANQNSSSITLENHYRCHHDIIGYSNHHFYGRFLDKPLNVMTDESGMTLPQKGIVMINIHGKQESENLNINRIEAERCVSLAKELCSLKADVSIGIVTPFRDQADYIKSRLDDSIKKNVEVNTAHGFQGDEKDVMIYSLVVTDNSPKRKINWIDYIVPNLVNVAVTRARQTLYVVGNADYIKAVSPEHNALGYLVRYAQTKTK